MRRALTWGLIAVMLVISGCSGSGGDDTSAASSSTTVSSAGAPAVTDLLGQDRVLAIAHAGGERDYPKETLFAFGEAVRVGADMLEMDVHLSADGQIVVIHDFTVEGTTDSTGNVADLSAEELGSLDAAHWFASGCGTCHDEPEDRYRYRGIRHGDHPAPDGYEPADFGVPTLAEVARRFPDVALDVEIKPRGEAGVATARALAQELDELGRSDSTVVVSFDQAAVDAFREAAPDVAVSPGVAGTADWILGGASLDDYAVLQVPPNYEGLEIVTPEIVSRAHDEGLDVWVWMNEASQETPEFYSELVDMGVDGIIGDHPRVLADIVG